MCGCNARNRTDRTTGHSSKSIERTQAGKLRYLGPQIFVATLGDEPRQRMGLC